MKHAPVPPSSDKKAAEAAARAAREAPHQFAPGAPAADAETDAPAAYAHTPLVSPATDDGLASRPAGAAARPALETLPEAAPATGGHLDQIRAILFGQQRAETDARLSELESLASAEIRALRRDLDARLTSLETYARAELDGLGRRLADERSERTEALAELDERIQRRSDGLARRLDAVLEATSADGSALRQQLLDETGRAREAVAERADALLREIDKRAETLGAQKADRSALAALFAELAARLADG